MATDRAKFDLNGASALCAEWSRWRDLLGDCVLEDDVASLLAYIIGEEKDKADTAVLAFDLGVFTGITRGAYRKEKGRKENNVLPKVRGNPV